jgi:hypothetical protein
MMDAVFWEHKGVLLIHETTMHNNQCSDLLSKAIKPKLSGFLLKGVLLLHDNAWPHSVMATLATFPGSN